MGTNHNLDLYLVRHGVTDWNQQKRYVGHTDRPVIESELSLLAPLKQALANIEFDKIVVSDLRRCQETFAYLQIDGEPNTDSRLREMNFGDWEGKTYYELKDDKVYQNWLNNWEEHTIPNGDSGDDFKSRVDSVLQELLAEAKSESNVLLVTHGGVIRYIVQKYHHTTSFWDFPIKHGTAITLSLSFNEEKGEWQCISLSAVPSQESDNV
ncbi:histidine phosphatase family protein [Metabacillus malikii]|uniref:Alpha-ribazole phosphatase n=1 Tax=Metabacillus malikii TaxID=1504265 RepID=A0ABT9ZAZ7_9BACI|nr:histidine phosphatase family protein [Metabacillus malikii]MDQ0228996.1 alpha-ribazole phosphatase [Metabacillus malikii]